MSGQKRTLRQNISFAWWMIRQVRLKFGTDGKVKRLIEAGSILAMLLIWQKTSIAVVLCYLAFDVYGFNIIFLRGTAAAKPVNNVEKYIEAAAKQKRPTIKAEAEGIATHFLKNPYVPDNIKATYLQLNAMEQNNMLREYWKDLQTGKYADIQ